MPRSKQVRKRFHFREDDRALPLYVEVITLWHTLTGIQFSHYGIFRQIITLITNRSPILFDIFFVNNNGAYSWRWAFPRQPYSGMTLVTPFSLSDREIKNMFLFSKEQVEPAPLYQIMVASFPPDTEYTRGAPQPSGKVIYTLYCIPGSKIQKSPQT